jgi:hypothetical protein
MSVLEPWIRSEARNEPPTTFPREATTGDLDLRKGVLRM